MSARAQIVSKTRRRSQELQDQKPSNTPIVFKPDRYVARL